MTLNQLRYFQTVARLENYHAAAEKLYISQPSLSRSIDSLEQELSVALFERAGRGIRLTKVGLIFLEYVDRILGECDMAVRKMKEFSRSGGRIDIGYVFPLANHYIPHMVRTFLNQKGNETVAFSFSQNRTPYILSEVKKGHLDVGFCAYAENENELEFYPLIKQEMVIIVPKNHPLGCEEKTSVMELMKHPVIGYDRFSGLGSYTTRVYQRLGISPDIICECPDENAIQALVRENFGIALVAMVDCLDEKDICILKLSDAELFHHVYMVWLKNHYHIPAIQKFITYMKNESDLTGYEK